MTDDAEQIQAKLVAYLEGQLSGPEKDEIEQHLQANPSHLALMRDLTRQRELLRALPRESAPADLLENFQAQLEREALLSEPLAPPLTLRIGPWRGMLAAAAIGFLAVGLGVVVYAMLPARRPTFSIAPTVLPPTDQPEATSPSSTGAIAKDAPARRGSALAVTPAEPAARGPNKAGAADGLRLKGMGEAEDFARASDEEPARPAIPSLVMTKPKGSIEKIEQPIAIDLDRSAGVITVTTDNLALANTAVNKYLVAQNISWTEEAQSNVQNLADKQQVARMARSRQMAAGSRGFAGGAFSGGFGGYGGGAGAGSAGGMRGGESTLAPPAAKSAIADRSEKNAMLREQTSELAKIPDPVREQLVERNLRDGEVPQKQLESGPATTRPADGTRFAARGAGRTDNVDAYNLKREAGLGMEKLAAQREIASGRVILARMNTQQATELVDALAQAAPSGVLEQGQRNLAQAGALNQLAERKADEADKLQSNRDDARVVRHTDAELRAGAEQDQKKSENDADQKRVTLQYRRAAMASVAPPPTTQPAIAPAVSPTTLPTTLPAQVISKLEAQAAFQYLDPTRATPVTRPAVVDLQGDRDEGWVIIVQGRQVDASSVAAPNAPGPGEAAQAHPAAPASPTTQPAATEVRQAK